MTIEEFSNEFDTLLNSWGRQVAYGDAYSPITVDEYEKSIFLTQSQEDIVLELYRGFEKGEELTEYLKELLKEVEYTNVNDRISLPEDFLFRIYETAKIKDSSLTCNGSDEKTVDVYPVTHDTLYRTKESPFRGSNKYRVLSLVISSSDIELISNYPISYYKIRYISKPNPIILENLPEGLSIDNKSTVSECTLNPILHNRILRGAVLLALKAKILYQSQKQNNTNNQ